MDKERNDVPKEDTEKFKEVFLYVLSQIGAYPNVGKTVLVKILYFIDFDYYEEKETQIMGMRYIKQVHGPYPLLFDKIVDQMKKDGDILETDVSYHGKIQTKYFPLRKADLSCLSAEDVIYINGVIHKHSSKNGTQIEEYSHKDVPWIAAEEKEELKYEGVFYRTSETSVRDYSDIPD